MSLVLRCDSIVGRSGLGCLLQRVLACLLPLGIGLVYEVVHCICHHTKVGGTVNVPHREGEVESHQLFIAGVLFGDEEGDGRDVLHPHPQPPVGVGQVYLAQVDWTNTRVGSEYLIKDVLERTPEAHRLHGG